MLINDCDAHADFTSSGTPVALSTDSTNKISGTGSVYLTIAEKELSYPGAGAGRNNIGTILEKAWTQTFTAISTKIDKIGVNVGTGSAGANFAVDLYLAAGDGKPTGGSLKHISVAKGSLNHEAETLLNFAVTGLSVSTRYVLLFTDDNTASDDHYKMQNNSGSTPTGQQSWKWDGSTWTDVTASIHNFYLKVIDYAEDDYVAYTPTLDLSNIATIQYWVRSNRTGTNMRIQMGEGGDEDQHSSNVTINSANTWEKKTWDVSQIAVANKNIINTIGFEVINDNTDFTFQFDEIIGIGGTNLQIIF